MAFDEKRTWVYLLVALVVAGGYFSCVATRAAGVPVADVEYVGPMLVAGAASITAVALARGLVRASDPHQGRRDVRDREVDRFGDQVGGIVLSAAVAGVLVLTWTEADHFWIANALYGAFVAQAVVSSAAKLAAYRRGL